jgi:hypothetical protein
MRGITNRRFASPLEPHGYSLGELGLLLPRLRGRGGEGVSGMILFACRLGSAACPLPIPPPQAGEGTDRARGVMMHPLQMKKL